MNIDKRLKAKIDENLNMSGARQPMAVWCQTCKYSHGEAPLADDPDKLNCEIYTPKIGIKPREVFYEGEECEFYEEEK